MLLPSRRTMLALLSVALAIAAHVAWSVDPTIILFVVAGTFALLLVLDSWEAVSRNGGSGYLSHELRPLTRAMPSPMMPGSFLGGQFGTQFGEGVTIDPEDDDEPGFPSIAQFNGSLGVGRKGMHWPLSSRQVADIDHQVDEDTKHRTYGVPPNGAPSIPTPDLPAA